MHNNFHSTITAFIFGAMLLCAPSVAATNNPTGFQGLQQPVLIIMGQYQDTEPPVFTAAQWADTLNQELSPYFESASGGNDSFIFVPVSGVCEFDYTYEDTAPGGSASDMPSGGLGSWGQVDDPQVRVREISNALSFAIERDPEIFNQNCRVLVVINRTKRAVSMFPRIHTVRLPDGETSAVYASAGLISDFSLRLANLPENDLDQDGIADADEELGPDGIAPGAFGDSGDATLPGFPDTDFDGFLDGIELDYGSDPNNSLSLPQIKKSKLALAAHELAHQFGLPDLYLYPSLFVSDEPIGSWGLMGSHALQNFSGYSRLSMGWLDFEEDLRIFNNPVNGSIDTVVTVATPNSDVDAPEILQFSIDPTGAAAFPFSYLLEARTQTGHDANLPSSYTEGVLVTRIGQVVPGTPILQPLGGLPVMTIAGRNCDECYDPEPSPFISRAALQVGERYEDSELGLEFEVVDQDLANETFDVRVQWQNDPKPDLAAVDIWVDNPGNGFGTFLEPTQGPLGDPLIFGDPIWSQISVAVDASVFPPIISTTTVPTTHRVFFRIENRGDAASGPVSGSVLLLDHRIPTDLALNDPSTWSITGTRRFQLSGNSLAAGESSVIRLDVPLDRPTIALVFIDPAPNETNQLDNWFFENYSIVQVAPGSPYQPAEFNFTAVNPNANGRFILPSILNLPNGWRVDRDRDYAFLDNQESVDFRFQFQAPDPDVLKPGQIETIETAALMNGGDTLIPIVNLPTHVVLNKRTEITLKATEQFPDLYSLSGTIHKYEPGAAGDYTLRTPLPNARLLLIAQSINGFETISGVESNHEGQFTARVPVRPNETYTAVAQFAGTIKAQESVSETVTWGVTEPDGLFDIQLSQAKILENMPPQTEVGALQLVGMTNDPIEYRLVRGSGDSGNDRFSINGDRIVSSESFDYETLQELNVRIAARTPRGDRLAERTFLISIADNSSEDADGDGILEHEERRLGTSDRKWDSDHDGAPDDVELDLASDPSSPSETVFPTWTREQAIRIQRPTHARFGTDRFEYLVGAEDGVLAFDRDSRSSPLVGTEAISALDLDANGNSLYYSTIETPQIERLDLSANESSPHIQTLPNSVLSIRRILTPSDAAFLGKKDEGIFLTQDAQGPGSLYRFSKLRPDAYETFGAQALESFASIVDITIDKESTMVLGMDAKGNVLLRRVHPTNIFDELPVGITLQEPAALAYDFRTDRILLWWIDQTGRPSIDAMAFRSNRWTPLTLSPEFDLGQPQPGGLAVADDGSALLLSNSNQGSVTRLLLEWNRQPTVNPSGTPQRLAGSTIRITGEHLSSILAFEIDRTRIETFTVLSDTEIELFVPPDAPSGPLTALDSKGRLETALEILSPREPLFHPADINPRDQRISQREIGAYGVAWKTNGPWRQGPTPIPREYLDNAIEIWRNGETYQFEPERGTAPDWWMSASNPR